MKTGTEGISLLRVSGNVKEKLAGRGRLLRKRVSGNVKGKLAGRGRFLRQRADGGGGSLSAAIRESIAAVNGLPFREGGGENGD